MTQLVQHLHQLVGLPFPDKIARPIMGAVAMAYAVALVSGLIVLLITGIQITRFTWDHQMTATSLPGGLLYLALPISAALSLLGLRWSQLQWLAAALTVDREEWAAEIPLIEEWFEFVGEKLPTGIKDEFDALKHRLAEEA